MTDETPPAAAPRAGVEKALIAHLEASRNFRGVRHALAHDCTGGMAGSGIVPADGQEWDRFREGFALLER